MPSIEQIIVLSVIILIIFCLYQDFVKPSVTFLSGTFLLMVLGIMKPAQFLAGFSNQSLMTIFLLIFISSALRKNFNISNIFKWIFHPAKSARPFLLMLLPLAAGFSSFINNTPMVAMLTPYVYDWGKRKGIPPSKLLIPLSYSTMLGGMITLIGTSTNLVVNGFLLENGETGLVFTDFLFLGILVSFVGITYLLTIGYKLLPSNKDTLEKFRETPREYVAEAVLSHTSALIGKTVSEARLRNLKGVFLTDIIRHGDFISPVTPKEVLQPDDRLIFAGETTRIVDLIKENVGLRLPQPNGLFQEGNVQITEVVVPGNSSLVGKTVKSSDFRNRLDAAILAIHRNGERLKGKIGEIRLAPGDLLLLSIGGGFFQKNAEKNDLYVINRMENVTQKSSFKTRLFFSLTAVAIFLSLLGLVNLFVTLLVILFLLFALRMFTLADLKNALDLDLMAILVCALALGNTLIQTETALWLSQNLIQFLQPFGHIGLLIGIFLLTVLLTSFITNAAAISVIFPITYGLTNSLQLDGTPFYVAITFAASAAFMTPFGYQTNLMVYGPGGYSFKHYFKVGLPLTILYSIICISFITFYYNFH